MESYPEDAFGATVMLDDNANRTVTVVSLVARPSHTRAEVEAEVVGLALFVHAISGTVPPDSETF